MKDILSVENRFGEKVNLPDGIYRAKWTVSQISFQANRLEYIINTKIAIKSMNSVDVVVIAKDGVIMFSEFSN